MTDGASENTSNRNHVLIDYEINNFNLKQTKRPVLVQATPDELTALAKDGFLHRKRLIDDDLLEAFRTAVDRLTEIEMKHPDREFYAGNALFIRYLMDKDSAFGPLLRFSPILSVVRAMLGPQVQLMDLVARVTFLDSPHQRLMWHIHNRVVPQPLPPFFAHPHGLDAIIYLDDATEANGPLCVLPGSHTEIHRKIPFGDYDDQHGQLAVPASAGDCIFSHSNIWHRVLPSSKAFPGERRRVLLMGFMPSWFKQDFPKGIRPTTKLCDEMRRSTDPEVRELLGEFEWT